MIRSKILFFVMTGSNGAALGICRNVLILKTLEGSQSACSIVV